MNDTAPSGTTSFEPDDGLRQLAAGDWLIRLQEDDLCEAEMIEWVKWSEADPRNLQAFEQLQSLIRSAAVHTPPPALLAQLLEEPCQPESNPAVAPPVRRLRHLWPAIAATVAAFCVGGWFAWSVIDAHRAGPLRAANVDTLATRTATNQSAILPDGSDVDIGARSVLDVDFAGKQRKLRLKEGQAFFRVTHDKDHPFVVNAGGIDVVAVGTAFDIRRSPAEVAVTVQEGAVNVIRNSGGELVRVSAGYQVVFDTGNGSIRQAIVNPEAALAWREGRFEFTGDPLETVVASINRYSGKRIVIRDPQVGRLAFTGTIFIDSIDASLDALAEVFPVDVQRTEEEVMLKARAD